MKKIKLHYLDTGEWFSSYINDLLKNDFEVELDSKNPNFLFFTPFSKDHIYYDCVRIFYTGENVRADFNFCDYAITFDYLDFGDRHIRFPLFLFEKNFHLLCDLSSTPPPHFLLKRDFCSFLVSNNKGAKIRTEAFRKFSEYKKVASGGKYLNNIGKNVEDKLSFISNYKFNIAFENSYTKGYVTEKLFESKMANSIPIYWGGLEKSDFSFLNKEAFINFDDYSNLDSMLDFVKYLDSNDDAYLSMLEKPLIIDKNYKPNQNEKLKAFLFNIFNSKDPYRRGWGQWRINIENRYKRYQKTRQIVNKIMQILKFKWIRFK